MNNFLSTRLAFWIITFITYAGATLIRQGHISANIFTVAIIILYIYVVIKRVVSCGVNPLFAFLFLIPFVNIIAMIYFGSVKNIKSK